MSYTPLVSIIISNYNGKELLRNCLNSLMMLEYPNYEVIVVDCGSTDGSAIMVKKEFPDVRLIKTERIGIGEAINCGISIARGDFLVFDLNNDDIVSKSWLNPLVKVLNSSSDIAIVCGKRLIADSTGILDSAGGKIILGVTLAIGHRKKYSKKYDIRREVDYVPVLMVKREVINKIGLLDAEYYIYGEDVDFCLRTRKAGFKIIYVPESVFWHQRSATIGEYSPRKLYFLCRNRIRIIIKNFSILKIVPLLVLHTTLIPFFHLIYYTIKSRGNAINYIKALKDAILWNFKNLRSTIRARVRRVTAKANLIV